MHPDARLFRGLAVISQRVDLAPKTGPGEDQLGEPQDQSQDKDRRGDAGHPRGGQLVERFGEVDGLCFRDPEPQASGDEEHCQRDDEGSHPEVGDAKSTGEAGEEARNDHCLCGHKREASTIS